MKPLAASAVKITDEPRPLRVLSDEVPPELADNPIVRALVSLSPAEEELLSGLSELDRAYGNEPTPHT